MQTAKWITAILTAILLTFFLGGSLQNTSTANPKTKQLFAQCLTEKGFTMYGTPWCPNCNKQKELFGTSFRYIKEINCDKQTILCKQKGIKGYPVWEGPDGRKYPGAKRFSELGQLSGCRTPRVLVDQGVQDISLFAAFLAGIVSFFAPCLLPLLPSYFSAITGFTFKDMYGVNFKKLHGRLLLSSLVFILGFSTVFSLLGATASSLGQLIQTKLPTLLKGSGILLIIFGLIETGILNLPSLRFDYAWNVQKKLTRLGLITSFITGIASALAWIPCIGPVLGSILLMAGLSQTTSEGTFLLFIYSVGIGAPFLIVSLFFPALIKKLHRHRQIIHYFSILTGIIMIGFGSILLLNRYQEYLIFYELIVAKLKTLLEIQ